MLIPRSRGQDAAHLFGSLAQNSHASLFGRSQEPCGAMRPRERDQELLERAGDVHELWWLAVSTIPARAPNLIRRGREVCDSPRRRRTFRALAQHHARIHKLNQGSIRAAILRTGASTAVRNAERSRSYARRDAPRRSPVRRALASRRISGRSPSSWSSQISRTVPISYSHKHHIAGADHAHRANR